MNQLRVSGDSALSMQPGLPNTVDDQRSSLLSILSKVKQQKQDGSNVPLNAEDRESIASFLRNQQHNNPQIRAMMGDSNELELNLQPNLQMFESLVSMMSQNTSGKRDSAIFSDTTSQLQQRLVEQTSNQ